MYKKMPAAQLSASCLLETGRSLLLSEETESTALPQPVVPLLEITISVCPQLRLICMSRSDLAVSPNLGYKPSFCQGGGGLTFKIAFWSLQPFVEDALNCKTLKT